MKIVSRLIFYFFSNAVALWAAAKFVPNFQITNKFEEFLIIAGIFTLINIFIRPIFKLVLTPVIILTLGLGVIVVNMIMLYFLEIFAEKFNLLFNITGLLSFLYATLIIGFVNILLNFFERRIHKED